MLSDEEKKAIEYLKIEYEKLMKEDNILFPLYKSDAKRLIDIIEKQSKEIEELKKYDKYFKEMEDTIKKIKQIVDIYYNTNGEFATLPNGEEICLSDNEPIIAYLQEILEEEN